MVSFFPRDPIPSVQDCAHLCLCATPSAFRLCHPTLPHPIPSSCVQVTDSVFLLLPSRSSLFAAMQGTYNHQVMFERAGGLFHLQWKNSILNEDEDGQRILYTHSPDGTQWVSSAFP